MQKIDILLFDRFSNHCLANTIEPLRAANTLARKDHYQWRYLTMEGGKAESSSGLVVFPHDEISKGEGDLLIVMPSYGVRALDTPKTTKALKSAARRYKNILGFDTGSWLLARAGFLDGKKATIHWEDMTGFEEAFPDVDVVRKRYVIDGDAITCSGGMTAFDVMMELIGRQHGPMLTVEVSQMFLTEAAARSYMSSPKASGRKVDYALHIMQENLETPLKVKEIARMAGTSQKALELHMKKELQATPSAVYRRLRLNFARKLLMDTDISIAEIANRCGYENASAMTRAFKIQFGQTPMSVRQS